MKIILNQDVDKVGQSGEIREVKPGFARNYLLPRGLAVLATPGALKELERTRSVREARKAKEIESSKELAAKIDKMTLSFSRPVGEGGKLFGSVGKADIAKSLAASGFAVDKTHVDLAAPFKDVGEYDVTLKLRPGVEAKVKVSIVARS